MNFRQFTNFYIYILKFLASLPLLGSLVASLILQVASLLLSLPVLFLLFLLMLSFAVADRYCCCWSSGVYAVACIFAIASVPAIVAEPIFANFLFNFLYKNSGYWPFCAHPSF
jgi:hypothetical protein